MKKNLNSGFLIPFLLVFFGGAESVQANLCAVVGGECTEIYTSPTGDRIVLNNCPHDNATPGQPGVGCSWDLCYPTRNSGPLPAPSNSVA